MQNESSNAMNGYAAQGFPPELKGRVVPGRLFITHDQVRFESPQARIALPIAGLQLRAGGHNNEQLFFDHPEFPGWAITSGDPALALDPVLRAHPALAAPLRGVERSRRRVPKPVIAGLALLALLLGCLLLIVLQRDLIVRFVVDRIPAQWEAQLGDQIFQQVAAQGTILEDSEWEPAVREIKARLLPVVEQSGCDFKFHIMQDTNVNAFAIPGGNVVILTGLLETAETPEEVAGVLAHEIAHVTERHSMRQIVQSAGLWVLVSALFGDATGVAAVLTEGSQYLVRQSFSRDFEREADDKGWEYLLQARIDPRGLTRFFEHLKEIHQGTALGNSLALLSTHPATDERIRRLESKWAELQEQAAQAASTDIRVNEPVGAVTPAFIPFENWPRP